MATGRGQGSRQPKRMEEPRVKPGELTPRMTQRWDKASPASSRNLTERMPPEVLLKILSYLDSVTLFSVSCVSRQLFELAKDKEPHLSWELTVTDQSGHQVTQEMSRALFFETSVTLCWSRGGCLPDYQDISTLQLHGVRSKARHHPGPDKFLMAELDMQALAESVQVLDQDGVVELRLLQPGFTIGIWRENSSQAAVDQRSIAFVMVTLHLHRLGEKCILGSPVCPYVVPPCKPPFDDIDPEYGLHGYQLDLVLHDTACEIMSESFYQLSCKRDQICDGLVQLTAVSLKDVSRHIPLSGNITLPWSCEVLQGTVKNCCIMNVTLLDEFKKAFWCVGSPVSLTPEETSWSFHYDGEHSLIHYQDSDGQVKMEFARTEERQQLILISLVIYVTVGKVNEHFCRDY